MKKCTSVHLWVYLNKRMTDEGLIEAFCNDCSYVDEEYYTLQKLDGGIYGDRERAYVDKEIKLYKNDKRND